MYSIIYIPRMDPLDMRPVGDLRILINIVQRHCRSSLGTRTFQEGKIRQCTLKIEKEMKN